MGEDFNMKPEKHLQKAERFYRKARAMYDPLFPQVFEQAYAELRKVLKQMDMRKIAENNEFIKLYATIYLRLSWRDSDDLDKLKMLVGDTKRLVEKIS